MTHIENVPHILLHGITHRNSPNANPGFTPIGDPSLISTRDIFQLDNGKLLGDYVPFYFGTRTPMLYVIQKGFNGLNPTPAQDVVYCVTSVQKIIESELTFVFTDGHAVDCLSTQYNQHDVNHLEDLLDWQAVKSINWKSETDLDLKRRKQAEFLVLGDVAPIHILGFVVYNEVAYNRLLEMGLPKNQIHINNNHYFAI
ncbi:DUF4433 domain-containing protein [Flavobacterium piscinae]|nr:DUF4433 domain-containing protein [Flavobacterium piscinae]MBC8883876.1 DUF4433 domain-containing protein [Flavobacterium piscinae]